MVKLQKKLIQFELNEMCNEVVGLLRLCLSKSEILVKKCSRALYYLLHYEVNSLHKVINEGKNSRHLLKSWNSIVLNEEE